MMQYIEHYFQHGFHLFFDSSKNDWGIYNIEKGLQVGILYRNSNQIEDVLDSINIWKKFYSLLDQYNQEETPKAWTVTPKEFWNNPLKYKIDLPTTTIRQGMKDGTLHQIIVLKAMIDELDVPRHISSIYHSFY